MKQWRPWRDPRPHSWGNRYTVLLLVVVAVALFLIYRQLPTEAPEQLTIGDPTPADVLLSETHRPVSDTVRERVLQGLIHLRSQYRPLRTDILVQANDDSPATATVVANLNQWLTTHQLRADTRPEFVIPESARPVQLVYPPEQSTYARHFAETLPPYINAMIELRSDDRLSPGALRLIIHQPPRFSEDGRVFFRE